MGGFREQEERQARTREKRDRQASRAVARDGLSWLPLETVKAVDELVPMITEDYKAPPFDPSFGPTPGMKTPEEKAAEFERRIRGRASMMLTGGTGVMRNQRTVSARETLTGV